MAVPLWSTCCHGLRPPVVHVAPMSSAGPDSQVSAKMGQDVLLQCQGPPDHVMMKWVRPDLGINKGYVLYIEGRIRPSYQHVRYKNRVELQDPLMKNGVYSVILKNVSSSDTGMFKCVIAFNNRTRVPEQKEGVGTRVPEQKEGVGTRVPEQKEGVGTRVPEQKEGVGTRVPEQKEGVGTRVPEQVEQSVYLQVSDGSDEEGGVRDRGLSAWWCVLAAVLLMGSTVCSVKLKPTALGVPAEDTSDTVVRTASSSSRTSGLHCLYTKLKPALKG